MKKYLAIILALVMVLTLSASAFAATAEPETDSGKTYESQTKDDPVPPRPSDPDDKDAKDKAKEDEEDNLYEIRDRQTDELIEKIPGTLTPFEEAQNTLEGADLEALKSAYDAARNSEGVVRYFFWFDIGDYAVAPENYLAFPFETEGENVRFFCNGEEVEVVEGYTAKLPSGGALAIVTD